MRITTRSLSVCLLGGTGFIGRHLAARLVRHGHRVTVVTRDRTGSRDMLVLPTLRLAEADYHDGEAMARIFLRHDAVVNLAGVFKDRSRDGREFQRAHVDLTGTALDAARTAGVGRFVLVSALKAADDAPSRFLRSKARAERLVEESGVDWTIVQPSLVFGPEDHFTNFLARLLGRLPVMPLARPNTRLAPVFVGDVSDAVRRALARPSAVGATYQLCGPEVYSLRELVDLIQRVLGLQRPVVPLTAWGARLWGNVMELLPGRPFSLDNYMTLSRHFICESTAPGFKALGMQATAIEPQLAAYLPGAIREGAGVAGIG